MDKKLGLVLEGGGMRGAYTAGVLDYLMKNNIGFDYIIGVSAGANNGANYISNQRERNKEIFLKIVDDDRFVGIKNLIKEGNYFGMDFLFREVPDQIIPFDYDTFEKSSIKFKVAVTSSNTAEAVYFDSDNHNPHFIVKKVLRASSSIPLISKPVYINGDYYYDGGIADPIPLKKSMKDGNQYNVLVLTKNKGNRLSRKRSSVFLKLLLKEYPALVKKLRNRYIEYNKCLDLIDRLENEGKVFVFRPNKKLWMTGLESNQKDITKLYNRGYKETKNRFTDFKEWLDHINMKSQSIKR
ncbi:MAG: patatin family protein [Halanaerobiales bacterium]|nr:patatin family protein [Halanaerobiales bacterium]